MQLFIFYYRITDLERLSIKVEEKKNTLLDLYKCYQGAREIGNLVECLKKMDSKLINQVCKYFILYWDPYDWKVIFYVLKI